MADSRTTKSPGTPILGGLFGVKPTHTTTIKTDSGNTYRGYGSTPESSQKIASSKKDRGEK